LGKFAGDCVGEQRFGKAKREMAAQSFEGDAGGYNEGLERMA
jgi:hypothetical protein